MDEYHSDILPHIDAVPLVFVPEFKYRKALKGIDSHQNDQYVLG